MLVKYVDKPLDRQGDAEKRSRLTYLQNLRHKITKEICNLESSLTPVTMVQTAKVIELDRDILAEEPQAYCIKARNLHNGRIVYLTKSQLRK